ncbi:hypothetical protein SSP35_01_09040 [Streptomyces sp. NBRC 110611]|uniref:hypothetical protein n=1 Tax=Streptomyces sp. NBRC 110611 TaxID=1621259 RepID=UPI00082B1E50|nr:hypothetical protein [Streptomyces sp. NBRC 110611]GAU65560.1 hypothetical protein SSP35_01_09040 [Streptomyces sp. NBRC 110611]
MKETVAARWRRVRRRCARAGGVLLAFTLVGLTAACSSEPSEKELRRQATSPVAESRREAEEHQIRALIQRLTAVEGLEYVLTRFWDSCGRPHNGSLFENNRSPYVLRCGLKAVAYFGIRGDVTDVLPRIRAAAVATWGTQDDEGRDMPYAAGTVTYALDYHRHQGRYPDGSLMPAPILEAPGLRIDWDRPRLPLPNRVEEPVPCRPAGSGGIYHRCWTAPEAPMSLADVRARYGTVLSFTLGGWDSSAQKYFTVPRRT